MNAALTVFGTLFADWPKLFVVHKTIAVMISALYDFTNFIFLKFDFDNGSSSSDILQIELEVCGKINGSKLTSDCRPKLRAISNGEIPAGRARETRQKSNDQLGVEQPGLGRGGEAPVNFLDKTVRNIKSSPKKYRKKDA